MMCSLRSRACGLHVACCFGRGAAQRRTRDGRLRDGKSKTWWWPERRRSAGGTGEPRVEEGRASGVQNARFWSCGDERSSWNHISWNHNGRHQLPSEVYDREAVRRYRETYRERTARTSSGTAICTGVACKSSCTVGPPSEALCVIASRIWPCWLTLCRSCGILCPRGIPGAIQATI